MDAIDTSFRNNSSSAAPPGHDPDELFAHCWRRNACGSCLSTYQSCGWCPTSQACIPATLGLLSPFSDPMICPSPSERFELRTRPLGCNVSTLTALTAAGSVLATLVVVGGVYAVLRWRAGIAALCRSSSSWCCGSDIGAEAVVDEGTSLLRGGGRRRRSWSYWVYNTVPRDAEGRPGVERSDTVGEGGGEAVGGREFEERRRRMLERSVDEV